LKGSFHEERNKRNISATLAQHGEKTGFLNDFVSLTAKRNNRNTFVCVRPFNYLAFFKKKE